MLTNIRHAQDIFNHYVLLLSGYTSILDESFAT